MISYFNTIRASGWSKMIYEWCTGRLTQSIPPNSLVIVFLCVWRIAFSSMLHCISSPSFHGLTLLPLSSNLTLKVKTPQFTVKLLLCKVRCLPLWLGLGGQRRHLVMLIICFHHSWLIAKATRLMKVQCDWHFDSTVASQLGIHRGRVYQKYRQPF